MADLKKLYGTDKEKENNGVWQDFGDGIKMRIARVGNENYKKLFQRLSKPHRKAIRGGRLSEEVAEKLMIKCLAETVLLDWENVEVDGELLPYSKDNAFRVLTDFRDVKESVEDYANDMEIFLQEQREEDAEDLKK